MIDRYLVAMACGLLLVAGPTPVSAADLAAARALYASASYEEALAMLSTIETAENIESVNQMRALCLLALGRTQEAEHSIERIILHNPGYVIETAAVSPKVVSLFRSVRQRTLPAVARTLYAEAKASFDEQRWGDATTKFTRMIAIVDDPELMEQRAGLNDLRQLGEGFLKLSEAQLAAASAKSAPPAAQPAVSASPPPASTAPAAATAGPPVTSPPRPSAPAPAAASPAPAARNGGQRPTAPPQTAALEAPIYSAQDQDVVPPVELQRAMPRWSPINRMVAQATYRGLIEIVIDERGAVEAAKMAKSVTAMYDDLLLQSARSWRYTPAKRNGRSVRYRQLIEIVLRPSQSE